VSEPVGLDVEAVVEMNVDLCAETGENSALLDAEGLAAAVARPWSGFGEHEAFPSMYEKAAALLHGIAARQVFENGNKRTAWTAAVTLLDINGIDLGTVETVQADMFVRAAALDHTLEIADLAEWFEVAHRMRRSGFATDPRVEYLALAAKAEPWLPGNTSGTMNVQALNLGGLEPTVDLPVAGQLCLISKINWTVNDTGSQHLLELGIEQDADVLMQAGAEWMVVLAAPLTAGEAHPGGTVLPLAIAHHFEVVAVGYGRAWLTVSLDGAEVGRMSFDVTEPLRIP